jgi:protein arginine kinase activator
MKCDLCDRMAVVHEVVLKNGAKREIHLCEQHARQAGVAAPQPLHQILTQFVVQHRPAQVKVEQRACPTCGLNFNQFRQHALLGCPDCYAAFERQLSLLIERTQNGGTRHLGRTPRRGGDRATAQVRRQRLIKELDEAVAAEQYERAAQLRDRLKSLEPESGAAGGDASTTSAGGT